jgi:hypothetical protein
MLALLPSNKEAKVVTGQEVMSSHEVTGVQGPRGLVAWAEFSFYEWDDTHYDMSYQDLLSAVCWGRRGCAEAGKSVRTKVNISKDASLAEGGKTAGRENW